MSLNNKDTKAIQLLTEHVEATTKLVPIISDEGLSETLLNNDHYATIKAKDPNRSVFDAIISASLLPGEKERMTIARYVERHIGEVIKLHQGDTKANGYLPKNPAIWAKIQDVECTYLVDQLDPSSRSEEEGDLYMHIFNSYLTVISAIPDSHIRTEVINAIIRRIRRRSRYCRFLNKYDAQIISRFNKQSGKGSNAGQNPLRTNQTVKKLFLETLDKGKVDDDILGFVPLRENEDVYMKISDRSGKEDTSILPLKKYLDITLFNPKSFIPELADIGKYYFLIQVYAGKLPLLDNTSMKGELDEDGNVSFKDVFLSAKVTEPTLGEMRVYSRTVNHKPCDSFLYDVIILPDGETGLLLKDRKLIEVVNRLYNSGQISEEERRKALAKFPEECGLLGIPDDLVDQTGAAPEDNSVNS